MHRTSPTHRKCGFTLVELLVVIGIIAVLISVLLPVLGVARRHAMKAKCAAQMRDIGLAMLMYAQDNRGYLPPVRLNTAYNIDGLLYKKGGAEVLNVSINENAKWWHFLGRYVTKKKTMAQTADEAGGMLQTTFWCPAFPGYVDAGAAVNLVGGINRNLPGIGMNWWPSMRPDYPAAALDVNGFPTNPKELFADCLAASNAGSWYKLIQFTQPAERALLGDSRQFYLESKILQQNQAIPGQRLIVSSPDYSTGVAGQSVFDFYRHGVYPSVADTSANGGRFSPTGGKIGYNVLYADIHVAQPADRETAYRITRMRYPG